MSEEIARAAIDFVIDSVERNGGRRFSLSFLGGGEPTLAWSLLERSLEYAAAETRRRGLQLRTGLTSNGTWSKSRGRWISEHFPRVTVSLDGPKEVMDSQRPTLRGKSVFEKVVSNVTDLVESGCNVAIRSTVSQESLGSMDAALDLFHSLGAKRAHFEPLTPVGRAWETGATPPNWIEFVDAFWRVFLRGSSLGIRVGSSIAQLNWRSQRYCQVGERAAVVTPAGQLTACHRAADLDGAIGDYFRFGRFDSSLRRFVIDTAQASHLASDAAEMPGHCQTCIAQMQCPSGCYYHNLLACGRALGESETRCRMTREFVSRYLEHRLHP